MDLFTYLLGKKGQNTQRDLFSYLLGKGAGGSGTYVNFTGTSLNISNTLKARIKNIELKGATSQHTTTGKNKFNATIEQGAILSPEGTDGSDNYNIRLRTNRFFLPAGDYIFSCVEPNREILLYYFTGATGNAYARDNAWNSTLSFTIEQDCYIRIMFRKSDNSTIVPTDITNPMIRLASVTDDTYEEYTGGQPSPSPDYPQPIKVVTGEQNIQIGTTNYPLSLGNMELCSSPDKTLKDYIYGSPNNWYKKSAITKIKLSDLTWRLQSYGFQTFVNLSNIVTPSNTNIMAILLCNVYRACTPNNAYGLTGSLEHGISVYDNAILVRETIIRDLNDFNTMISSANVYLLNIEPTDTQITDTTLIEQLNNLYNAISAQGTTYITCSSASDSNEIIVFSGDIKVTSVGNSLNTSLLSSNLQEETNIDDIQEEPTLDDVNETEDIEQNEEPIEEKVS